MSMTTIAQNNTYRALFAGQAEVYAKSEDNVLLRLEVPSSQANLGATFLQQVCPVIITQEPAPNTEELTELKKSEALPGNSDHLLNCTYCNKPFVTEDSLKRHLDTAHRGLRRFQCTICGKAYAKSFLLKSHIKSVHENIRDVTCTICQKAFSKRSVMRRHMKSVHAEKKDYHCTICQKDFTEKKNLQMHINSLHKGLRPYRCNTCLKEFARKCDLLRHANSVHKESKPYMCPICNKGFPQKWYFERHIASVHKKSAFPVNTVTARQQQQQQPQPQPQQQPQPHLGQHMQQPQTQQPQTQQTALQAPAQQQQPQQQSHSNMLPQQQQFAFFQPPAQGQTMNLPMGTIIATPGSGASTMPPGTQVMMVAPSMNMPMSTFFFQPQQASSFTNPQPTTMHPAAVLPGIPTTLMPQSSGSTTTSLITSPFGITQLPMTPPTVTQTQVASSSSRPTKEYQCMTCSKVYPRRQSLQAHMIQVHSDKKPYECKLCMKGFVRRWDFYRHVNSVHQDNATSAIDADKTEEYLAWMRGRQSCLDISWECLNAVRPDLLRVKAEDPSSNASAVVQQQQTQQAQVAQQQAQPQPQQQQTTVVVTTAAQPHQSEADPFRTQNDLAGIVPSDINSL